MRKSILTTLIFLSICFVSYSNTFNLNSKGNKHENKIKTIANSDPLTADSLLAGNSIPNIELSGNLTLDDLRNAAPFNTTTIFDWEFSNDANTLRTFLRAKGNLTLKNATLVIPNNYSFFFFLGANKLTLINSKIILNSAPAIIICNSYEQDSYSSITSYSTENIKAKDGENYYKHRGGLRFTLIRNDAANGKNGPDVFCFVTDSVYPNNMRFDLSGQNGGNGYKGFNGSTGQRGSNGHSCSDGVGTCRRGCSNGSNGNKEAKDSLEGMQEMEAMEEYLILGI